MTCGCRKGAPVAGCPTHTVSGGDLGAASFKGMVPKPAKSAGGVSRKKAAGPRSFREIASRERWREIHAAKHGPCYVCWYLGRPQLDDRVTLHHVVAKSLGGSDTEANLVPLCGDGTTGCHGLVEAHDQETCQAFAAALQKYDDAAYAYAVGKLGEDGFLRRYKVKFRRAA